MSHYTFPIKFEPDDAIWRAYVPDVPAAHAWGDTKDEALTNLINAIVLVIEDLEESGESIPSGFSSDEQHLLTVAV